MSDLCAVLRAGLPRLFNCEASGGSTRIRTPFLYPDGGLIDLYIDADGADIVTDSGETVGWLNGQTAAPALPEWLNEAVKGMVAPLGVDYSEGELSATLDPGLAAAGVRVGMACVRGAEQRHRFRAAAPGRAVEELASILTLGRVEFGPGLKEVGRSGHSYKLPFRTRTPARTSLLGIVARGAGAKSRQSLEHTYTMWSDLSDLRLAVRPLALVTVFDDVRSDWTRADYALLSGLSDVARLSRPASNLEAVGAVA